MTRLNVPETVHRRTTSSRGTAIPSPVSVTLPFTKNSIVIRAYRRDDWRTYRHRCYRCTALVTDNEQAFRQRLVVRFLPRSADIVARDSERVDSDNVNRTITPQREKRAANLSRNSRMSRLGANRVDEDDGSLDFSKNVPD